MENKVLKLSDKHTLLIICFLGVAFILGFLTGKRYGKINLTKIS
jgi:hypothetical protein